MRILSRRNRWGHWVLLAACAMFAGCQSQPDPDPSMHYGPPRMMGGSPTDGFRAAPGFQGSTDMSGKTGESLPQGWHGFGGN